MSSKAYQIADALASRINGHPTLLGVYAVAYREKDMASIMAKREATSTAATIIILYLGFVNPDASSSGNVNVTRRYLASVFSRPSRMTEDDIPGDAVAERAALALHHWEPDETATGAAEVYVREGSLRVDGKHAIYDLEINVLSRL